MYNALVMSGALLVLATLLVHYKPASNEHFAGGKEHFAGGKEHFAIRAVDLNLMPVCISRSTDAQSLLSRFQDLTTADAAEMRLLVSKLCCMETDIASPSAGVYRTMNLQFRTSEDMEPPATIVGRCLRNAVNKRDIELMMEKFTYRGHELIKGLCSGSGSSSAMDEKAATAEFDKVVAHLRFAMVSFCLKEQPHMDRPLGARDMGFWEPENVADLSQYQGVSATPK